MNSFFRHRGQVLILCFCFFAWGLFRLNDLSLYTDSDRYVIWGTSLAQGNGFIDATQPEPERYVVNAPLYSIVLAPAVIFLPHSLAAAKVMTLLFGSLAIFLFYRWLTHYFSNLVSFFVALLLAVNPMMLVLSSEALSEAVFLAALFGLLPMLEANIPNEPARRSAPILLLTLLAVLPLLREAAVSAVFASCMFFAAQRQWKSLGVTLGLTTLFVGGWAVRNLLLVGVPATSQDPNFAFILQHHVTPSTASMLEEIGTRTLLNAKQYGLESGGSALYLFPTNLIVAPSSIFKGIARSIQFSQVFFPFVVIPLLLAGIGLDIRQNVAWMWRLLFLATYSLIVLIYPVHDLRFILPLLPFLFFYLALGLSWSGSIFSVSTNHVRTFGLVGCAAVLIPNGVADFEILRTNLRYRHAPLEFYREAKAKGLRNEYFTHPWSLAGSWFDAHSSSSAVIASASKGLATFLNGRKLLEINSAIPMPTFERMIRKNAVEYIATPTIFEGFHAYEQFVGSSRRVGFDRVADLGDIRIWKVSPRTTAMREEASSPNDSSAWRMMIAGCRKLQLDKPIEAASFFDRTALVYSSNAAIRFHQFLASTFGENSEQSKQLMEELFSLPQSTSYQRAARNYLEAQRKLFAARSLYERQPRAAMILECAQFYWDFGFSSHALALVDECVRTDQIFFTGLLWAHYYSRESGELENARKYLRKLRSIDSTNRVVHAFSRVDKLDVVSQKLSADALVQARLDIAKAFADVELFDSAVDEAERATEVKTPASYRASLWLAEFYEARGNLRAAQAHYRSALATNASPRVQEKINAITRRLEE